MRPKNDIALFYIINEENCLGLYKVLHFFYTLVHETKGKDGQEEMLCNKWVWTAGEHLQLQEVRRVLRSPDCCAQSESLETIHNMP